jgi:hypothetical protein
LAELHEGLAQYAGLRAVMMLGHDPAHESSAAAEAERILGDLDGLITDTSRSFRLRFYSTGPAMSLILDRLADFDWKARMMQENATLQDALAEVVGFWERQRAWQLEAYFNHGGPELAELAERSVNAHRELRRAQVEEALAQPGVRLVSTPAGSSPAPVTPCAPSSPHRWCKIRRTLRWKLSWARWRR